MLPQTSHLANKHAEQSGLKVNDKQKIITALQDLGAATCWQIANWKDSLYMNYSAVARRMKELETEGLVYSKGTSDKSPSGRLCLVWYLSKQPLAAWNGTQLLTQGKMFE